MTRMSPLKYFEDRLQQDEIIVVQSLIDDLSNLKYPLDYKKAKALLTPKYGIIESSSDSRTLLSEKLKIMHLIQFVCGYFDIDLRDSVHIGHGACLLNDYMNREIVNKYWGRVFSGELVGIAMTEPVGGSFINTFSTKAKIENANYIISGKKIHVSRIKEADIFVLVFKNEMDDLSATVLESLDTYPELTLTYKVPAGLKGWSWGEIEINNLVIPKNNVLIESASEAIEYHFLYYRPLVCSLILGSAARILDEAINNMQSKMNTNKQYKVRDTTLSTAARLNEFIRSYLFVLQNVVPRIDQSSYINSLKADIVDNIYNLLIDLSLSMGASGFVEESIVSKNLNAIRAYMFADGINDALIRSSGKRIFTEQ